MRRRVENRGPYEARFGYSRAVAEADRCWVSGCTSIVDGAVACAGDAYGRARTALRVALDALTELGFGARDVVRTRMYITDRRYAEAVGRAHAEAVGAARPAATMVVVAGLIDPAMLVEIEVDACREAL